MNKTLTLLLALLGATGLWAQTADTLSFFSKAFNEPRTVYVIKPEFYKYQSEEVRLPVIYLLDGQHEWLVNPLSSTIKYLQYTHQIPQSIVVIIPLRNRNAECSFNSETWEPSPLHRFITTEVDDQLKPYHPNGFKTLIGHSFSASFALYSSLLAPDYYSAVIAHTPLDALEKLILRMQSTEAVDYSRISISTGGKAQDKDFYHRSEYERLKAEHPAFFTSVHTFEADYTGHTAVPIVATPYLLTQIFADFSSRYTSIAEVNSEYKLKTSPISVDDEMQKTEEASRLGHYFFPPEIPEINGLASRYANSGLNDYAIAVYEKSIQYFPSYYEFHLALYELYMPRHMQLAKTHLNKAAELLTTLEANLPEQQELLQAINLEKNKNGW